MQTGVVSIKFAALKQCLCIWLCQVRYSRGLPFLWRATWSAGKAVVSSDNRASQDLEPKGRTVENKVEYAGPDTFISASGTYQPLVSLRACTCTCDWCAVMHAVRYAL